MGSMSDLVAAIDSRVTGGGVENVMQPGRLVSVDPPEVELCGVRIKKQVHVNPAMRNEADLGGITDAMARLTGGFEALAQVKDAEPPEIVQAVMELAGPMEACFEAVRAVLEQGLVHPGDGVMVRQDGNDIHVMSGTGG